MEKVSIEGVALDLVNNSAVLILKGEKGKFLPIAIRILEAQSILIALEKTSFFRPLTHDLIKNIIESLSAKLLRLEIHSLKKGVYYAHLVISKDGNIINVDCRPSDGIAISLRLNADIMVSDNLLEKMDIIKEGKDVKFFKTNMSDKPISEEEASELRKMIDDMSAKEFWKELDKD